MGLWHSAFLFGMIMAQTLPVFAFDVSAGRASSLVQQDLTIKVSPLTCSLEVEELNSLTCRMPISELNLPKGGQLVPVTTVMVMDRVTIKAWPRDSATVQVELSRKSETDLDLKGVWHSGTVAATVIYHGPFYGKQSKPLKPNKRK